jgi:hypothetical protein
MEEEEKEEENKITRRRKRKSSRKISRKRRKVRRRRERRKMGRIRAMSRLLVLLWRHSFHLPSVYEISLVMSEYRAPPPPPPPSKAKTSERDAMMLQSLT